MGTSAKFREESERSRSLSRGDSTTQSLGSRRVMSKHLERKRRRIRIGEPEESQFEKFGNWQDVEWRGQFVATAEHEKVS